MVLQCYLPKKRFTRKNFQQKEVATAIFRFDVSLCIHCFQNIDENIVKCETTGPLKYTTYWKNLIYAVNNTK